jgi:hypothetical protein
MFIYIFLNKKYFEIKLLPQYQILSVWKGYTSQIFLFFLFNIGSQIIYMR